MERALAIGIVVIIALQRLAELKRSRRNEEALKARGAQEFGQSHYIWMVFIHASWLLNCLMLSTFATAETWMVATGTALLIGGQILRYLAIETLGPFWNTRILVIPGEPRIQTGIYRWMQHPNYLGVCLEIAGLPLVLGSLDSALLFSLANASILIVRLSVETSALKALRIS